MFSATHMNAGYNIKSHMPSIITPTVQVSTVQVSTVPVITLPEPVPLETKIEPKIDTRPFTPFQKDKLFWCFFIIIKGYEEYEMSRTNSFSVEKRIKIEAVEKLKTIKDKLKELKFKRTELENELVHQPTISVKGLYALCLVYDVSLTYIYGRTYCEMNKTATDKKGTIIQNEKKEASLRWFTSDNDSSNSSNSSNDDVFYKKIQEEYWLIENIQKPLKASSAYTIKELQDISIKLHIDLNTTVNDKQKSKTKSKLYEEIYASLMFN
jgi:hypothetical protein